jgi:hypothetical protein
MPVEGQAVMRESTDRRHLGLFLIISSGIFLLFLVVLAMALVDDWELAVR